MTTNLKTNPSFGDWQGLNDNKSQQLRYTEVVNIIQNSKREQPQPLSILDIGCGEGTLANYLDPATFSYEGIDPSTEAIFKAEILYQDSIFINSSAEDFIASSLKKYDYIVFNEMLYYSKDPISLVEKYSKYLTPQGVLIFSFFQKKQSLKQLILNFLGVRPFTNIKVEKLVRNYIKNQSNWTILEDKVVQNTNAGPWHIWGVKIN